MAPAARRANVPAAQRAACYLRPSPEDDEMDEAETGEPSADLELTLRAHQPSDLTKAQTEALEAAESRAQAPTANRAPRPRPAHIARDNVRLTIRWQMV